MLQPLSPSIDYDEGDHEQRSPLRNHDLLASLLGLFRRQFPVTLLVFFAVIGAAGVYLATAPPRYTARATMIIDSRKVQVFSQSVLGDVPIDTGQVESQVEVLRSDGIAEAVIKDLRLTDDPEFTGPGGGLFGSVLRFAGGMFRNDGEAARSDNQTLRAAVNAFAARLNVRRVGLTYLMEISFLSLDANKSARIANAIAEAYIRDQLDAKYQATRRASTWLQDRIGELRDQVAVADRAVLDFKEKNNIVDVSGRLMNEQLLSEMNSQLVIAQEKTAETKARLDRIEAVQKADVPDAAVSDVLKSDVITKFRQQYLELSAREAIYSSRYGPTHMASVNLRTQMREIRRAIHDELNRIAETYKSDFQIAKVREGSLRSSLATTVTANQATGQASVTLRTLESNAQSYRTLYDNFLQRYMESVQQQSFPITEARVISAAAPPLSKSEPKTLLIGGAAVVLGLCFGLGAAWLRDTFDRVFRSPEQIETHLNQHCLATLPVIKATPLSAEQKLSAKTKLALADGDQTRILAGAPPAMRYAIDNPFSYFSESLRHIRVAADLAGIVRANKIIGLTSTLPSEGKSTLSTNLAQLISQGGAKVLLVDGDLRNPSLSRALTPGADKGLIEVLAGQATADEVMWHESRDRPEFPAHGHAARVRAHQ